MVHVRSSDPRNGLFSVASPSDTGLCAPLKAVAAVIVSLVSLILFPWPLAIASGLLTYACLGLSGRCRSIDCHDGDPCGRMQCGSVNRRRAPGEPTFFTQWLFGNRTIYPRESPNHVHWAQPIVTDTHTAYPPPPYSPPVPVSRSRSVPSGCPVRVYPVGDYVPVENGSYRPLSAARTVPVYPSPSSGHVVPEETNNSR